MNSVKVRWRSVVRRCGLGVGSRRRAAGIPRLEALESRQLLAVAVSSLTGTEGFPLVGQVATFASTDVQGTSPAATIAWGDGHTTTGTVVTSTGGYAVNGSNTYAVPGTYPVTVTITGTDASTATGQGQATVAALTLSATGTTVTPTAGQPFTGMVASFTDPYPSLPATDYAATIAWGNGHTSVGTIAANGNGGFNVSGTNTYAAPGSQTVSVMVTRLIDNQTATAMTNAVVVAPALTAVGTTIVATVGQAFNGTVATFSDAMPGTVAGSYHASIAWGDGQTSVGTVVANGQGGFTVIGTHYYSAPSSGESILVTIARNAGGQAVTASSTGVVGNASYPLTGGLDMVSDTGVSSTDGVTAINQPTFVGSAAPYAIVQLFARRTDQAQPVLLGQAIANASGIWSLPVGALPDGFYTMTVTEMPPAGFPTAMSPAGTVVIDTRPPTVNSATIDRHSGQVAITFQDGLSGMLPKSLLDAADYALVRHHGPRLHPSSVTVVPNATVATSDPVTILLRFNVPPKDLGARAVAVGGITDLAGNPLGRQYLHLTEVAHGAGARRRGLPPTSTTGYAGARDCARQGVRTRENRGEFARLAFVR